MPHPLSSKLRNHQRIARLSRQRIQAILDEHPLTAMEFPADQIKLTYDAEADAAYLTIGRGRAVQSINLTNGLVVDLNVGGQIVGVEIQNASTRFQSKRRSRLTRAA